MLCVWNRTITKRKKKEKKFYFLVGPDFNPITRGTLLSTWIRRGIFFFCANDPHKVMCVCCPFIFSRAQLSFEGAPKTRCLEWLSFFLCYCRRRLPAFISGRCRGGNDGEWGSLPPYHRKMQMVIFHVCSFLLLLDDQFFSIVFN